MVAHALIDAVLGAAGLGDIGSMFPSARPERPDGISSLRCSADATRRVARRLRARERRLRPDRRAAAGSPNAATRWARGSPGRWACDAGSRVRATTTDGLGFTGRGEGLAAQAVALLRRHEARPLRRPARPARDPATRSSRGGRSPSTCTTTSRVAVLGPAVRGASGLPARAARRRGARRGAALVPTPWDGTDDDLPPGWDEAFPRAFESGREPDVLCRARDLRAARAPGRAALGRMLNAMRDAAARRGPARADRARPADAEVAATR